MSPSMSRRCRCLQTHTVLLLTCMYNAPQFSTFLISIVECERADITVLFKVPRIYFLLPQLHMLVTNYDRDLHYITKRIMYSTFL